ncbi:hypothetical protein GCM10009785_01280 [Brooklawnia cerclae]|uniref:DOD-type homing endonuclease domain-containing protein n=1 Tax=Brooklawnia cerclae TaxID=349934 RepID=A0ABX0SEH3_9ACTN|nr:LAGLIDADG family homing endonuclease [Brooklawnia cerclae]NIH56279.1 hypothetical protein [Brooklawnia cerclae]
MPDIVDPLPPGVLDLGNVERATADILAAIHTAITDHPRSQQTEIGPSEVGIECDRRLAYKLLKFPEPERDNWKATVGTAVHAWMEEVFDAYNLAHPEFGGQERYLIENRVSAGVVPHLDYQLEGNCDLYDRVTATVVDWKGLPLDTPIPTPDGWTTQADLKAGDTVFSPHGLTCQVVKTYPVQQRPCFRVSFTDGTSIVTDDVQQLTVSVGGKKTVTASVADLRAIVREPGGHRQRQLRLYNASPLLLPEAELPVHPYVLGAWLGDGGTVHGTIGKPDEALFDNIRECGYDVGPADKRGITRTVHGLQTQLRELGLQWVDGHRGRPGEKQRQVIAGKKEIPASYLRASYHQRLDLLQGLMDTDGTWNRRRNQAVFTTTSEVLAEGVRELVATLGWRARIYPQLAHGFGKTVTAYQVAFVPFGANPFRLPRKADLVHTEGTTRSQYRLVESIEPAGSVPTRCIDVNSSSHLYLAGRDMIPVHNCVGPSQLKHYRSDGPSQQYRVQANLYGYAWVLSGFPVRTVMIAFLPRNGELSEAYLWSEPYTEQVALDAIARLAGIAQVTSLLGPASLALLGTHDSWCAFCPFFRRGSADLATGCPGHPGSVANAAPQPHLTLTK